MSFKEMIKGMGGALDVTGLSAWDQKEGGGREHLAHDPNHSSENQTTVVAWGELMVCLHDLGKYNAEFQRYYLQSDPLKNLMGLKNDQNHPA